MYHYKQVIAAVICLLTLSSVHCFAANPTDSVASPAKISKTITSLSKDYRGISRIVNYEFAHPDIPKAFDGCRIAFISDTHYKSLFDETGLANLTRLLREQKPDLLLLGGDFQEGCEYVQELFDSLQTVNPKMGIYGVLGNNDYERCTDEIRSSMKQHDMRLLEQVSDTVFLNDQFIILSGIENSTASDAATVERIKNCPTLSLHKKDFVILLTHTPDYAELYSTKNTDLVLAGHTHGGQVTIFGHAPKVPSVFGERFLTGLKYTSQGTPIIITNGIGTSQLPIRIGAPAEIVMIKLISGNGKSKSRTAREKL